MASKRRQQIIDESISLFNKHGYFNVSIKDICDSMQISPGNLTYHFRKKEDLFSAIQEQMIKEGADLMVPKGDMGIDAVIEGLITFQGIQNKYNFYYNSLLYISRRFPEIVKDYRNLTRNRFEQGKMLIEHLIATDRLMPEEPSFSYERMIQTVWMVATFWTAQKSILLQDGLESQIPIIKQIIRPYLTLKGLKEMHKVD